MADVRWRELSGAGDHTAPPFEQSRSSGDLQRNSYRRSQYPRLSGLAVMNDDGTPIAATLEDLLRGLLDLTGNLLQRIQEPVYDAETPAVARLQQDASVPVHSRLWVSPAVEIPYGATAGALDAGDAMGNKFQFDFGVDGEPLPQHGRILSMDLIDRDNDTLSATVHMFSQDFAAAASDAQFTIAPGDAANWVTSQAFDVVTSLVQAKVSQVVDINKDYYAPEHKLYCQASTSGTPNIAGQGVMPLVRVYILPLEG